MQVTDRTDIHPEKDIMRITLRSFARFREIFGEEQTIETTSAATPKTVLSALCEEKGCKDTLFAADGTFHPHITVILNGRRLSAEEIEETSLADNDALVVYPPVSGG
jgi:sulfur-carrier protein